MIAQSKTKPALLERLARGDLLIGDGATGTFLQAHGLEPGGCPEELNASNPDLVKSLASQGFDAGADFVLTNSFGGSRFMQQKYGYGDRVREFARLAAEHAKSVAPDYGYVLGSVGPTGEFLEPLGEVSEAEMYDAFAEQVTALKEGGADAILVETMIAVDEAALAVRAAKNEAGLPAIATMTFDRGPRGFFTMMGVKPPEAAAQLLEAGADVVGSNCGNGIEAMIEVAREMRHATKGYLMINSNAGIPSIRKGQIVYPEEPGWMAERFVKLADMGINLIGGCCGTTPAHVRALSTAIRG